MAGGRPKDFCGQVVLRQAQGRRADHRQQPRAWGSGRAGPPTREDGSSCAGPHPTGLHHFWARTKLHESGGRGSLPHACCTFRPIAILGDGVAGDRDEQATFTCHPICCGPRPSWSSRGVSPTTGRCACFKKCSASHVAQLGGARTGCRLEKWRVSIARGHHPLDGIAGKREHAAQQCKASRCRSNNKNKKAQETKFLSGSAPVRGSHRRYDGHPRRT